MHELDSQRELDLLQIFSLIMQNLLQQLLVNKLKTNGKEISKANKTTKTKTLNLNFICFIHPIIYNK